MLGEAGIGKTRLTEAFAAAAARSGKSRCVGALHRCRVACVLAVAPAAARASWNDQPRGHDRRDGWARRTVRHRRQRARTGRRGRRSDGSGRRRHPLGRPIVISPAPVCGQRPARSTRGARAYRSGRSPGAEHGCSGPAARPAAGRPTDPTWRVWIRTALTRSFRVCGVLLRLPSLPRCTSGPMAIPSSCRKLQTCVCSRANGLASPYRQESVRSWAADWRDSRRLPRGACRQLGDR